jgi:thiol-disulfide isomerase/thioredoxin
MGSHRSCAWVLLPVAATLALAAPEVERVPAVRPGDLFPPGSYANLNAAEGAPTSIDLVSVLGRKPVVFCYWIPTNSRSEALVREIDRLGAELGPERIAVFGVAVPRPTLGEDVIRERAAALGLRLPVLQDTGFVLGQRLQVSSVPNVSILDREGRLRLANGASLRQVLGYDLDLEKAIRRTAATGTLLSVGYLDRYFPVHELTGEKAPDFRAPLLEDSVEQRWHSLLDDEKINVLIFWSVDCPHCRQSLPEINTWLAEHPDGVNVVSCASVTSASGKTQTAEFCKLNGFSFPTLVDEGSRIGDLYRVTSTPTIVIMGPDGVIDSALTSGHIDFGKTIEEKKRKLLGARPGA